MTHDSKRSKNTLLPAIAFCLLALAVVFFLSPLTGCGTANEGQASQENNEKQQSSNAESSSEASQTNTHQPFKIDTESYSIEMPAEWSKYADVEYDTDGNAQVIYKSNASVVLLTCTINEASDDVNEGDVGNGLVSSTKLSDGKRLDVWAPNYTYQFWSERMNKDATNDFGKLSNSEKERIIKLTSGKTVKVKRLYKIKSEAKVLKKYGTNYDYLGKLVKKGTSVK